MEDEIQRYLADFPQIFSFDKQRELISQFKFLLNQAKAEKFGTQCDDAWSCLGPVEKLTNTVFMDVIPPSDVLREKWTDKAQTNYTVGRKFSSWTGFIIRVGKNVIGILKIA